MSQRSDAMSILNRPTSVSILGLITARVEQDRTRARAPRTHAKPRQSAHSTPLTLTPPSLPRGSFPEARLSPPRGWYADPVTAGLERRWDGFGWTTELRGY